MLRAIRRAASARSRSNFASSEFGAASNAFVAASKLAVAIISRCAFASRFACFVICFTVVAAGWPRERRSVAYSQVPFAIFSSRASSITRTAAR